MSSTPNPPGTQASPGAPVAPAEAGAGAGTPVSGWGRWRSAAAAAFAAASLLLVCHSAHAPPSIGGDIWEHWLIAESFDRHGSPELRPEDMAAVYAETDAIGWPHPVHPHAYLPAPDGRYYGVHFWAYPLCGVPAKAYRRWAGRYEVGWPAPTNAALFALAIGVTLFAVRFPVGERLALAGLATAGPGWAYVDWPGSELFSWAFALIAVATFRDRRYGWSALGSGLAALQNPPVILFGGVAVLVALWEKRWRAAAGAVLGTAVGLIPYAFFYYHFGKPNLIAEEYARAAYISWCRTWGQLTDLNHGLLPYAPLLAFGFVFAAVRVALRRDLRELALLGATVAVAVATQVSRNWNSSCDGIQRYLVWLIPLVAGVIVCGFRNGRALWAFAALAVVFHSALVPIYREEKVVPDGYLGHTTMAKWVLTHCPELYWVESEVFIERTRHNEIFWPERTDGYPTGFVRPDGTVSKLILLPDCVERVPAAFEADEAYLAALRAEAAGRANSPGPYYVHPPRGALRAKAPPAR